MITNLQVFIKPTWSEIANALKKHNEAWFCEVSRTVEDEMVRLRRELENMGKSEQDLSVFEGLDDIHEIITDVDYLNMTVDEIDAMFSFLFEQYEAMKEMVALRKRALKRRKDYYPIVSTYVGAIYEELDEILEMGGTDYISYVAEAKTELPENYADMIPYESISEIKLTGIIKMLESCESENQEQLSRIREEKARKDNLAIGDQSIQFLGITSIEELDDAVRRLREDREKQTTEKVQAFASSLSALKGDKSSLASIFDKGQQEPYQKEDASEEKDVSNGINDDREVIDVSVDTDDTSESGVNPKGE